MERASFSKLTKSLFTKQHLLLLGLCPTAIGTNTNFLYFS